MLLRNTNYRFSEKYSYIYSGIIISLKNSIENVNKESEAIELAQKLEKHHERTLIHCSKVADDVEYVAKVLGYDLKTIASLKLATYFHDIGKLNIFSTIIDLGGNDCLKKIWKSEYLNNEPQADVHLLAQIKVIDAIKYFAEQSNEGFSSYMKNFKLWAKENGLNPRNFLQMSLKEYLKSHQNGTKDILTKYNFSKEIILYAATHHPDYLFGRDKRKLPQEVKIIEIADRMNAINQTEGLRTYCKKKSKLKALLIILKVMLKRIPINDSFWNLHNYEKTVILILLDKYFSDELMKEIYPKLVQFRIWDKEKRLEKKEFEELWELIYYIETFFEFLDIFENNKMLKDKKFQSLRDRFSNLEKFFNNSYNDLNLILEKNNEKIKELENKIRYENLKN